MSQPAGKSPPGKKKNADKPWVGVGFRSKEPFDTVHGDPVARYHQNGVFFDNRFQSCGGRPKMSAEESLAKANEKRHKKIISELQERAARAEGVLGDLGPATIPREVLQARKENARALAAERLADE